MVLKYHIYVMDTYDKQIKSSAFLFEELKYLGLTFNTVTAIDDATPDRRRTNHRIRVAAALGAVLNEAEGVAQQLLGLIQPPTGELHGLIKATCQLAGGRIRRNILVSRFPYGNQTRASLIGRVMPNIAVKIKPSQEVFVHNPRFANSQTILDITEQDRLGIEHLGLDKSRVLTLHEEADFTSHLPHELWAPASKLVRAGMHADHRMFAGAHRAD
jgi:hypothetical protein